MALIFSRLAHNHVKNGYYPTDDETLARIQCALLPPLDGSVVRLLDPCCGTGAALADLAAHLVELQTARTAPALIETYGIELNSERAWEAKKLLYRAVHADVHDVVVKARSASVLFLNPPYGFGVSDATNADRTCTTQGEAAERLERTFLKRTVPTLKPSGLLIFIVPFYAVDADMRNYLARHFRNVRCFMAPEQQFQQCVIFGQKVRPLDHPDRATLDLLTRLQAGELKDVVLPEVGIEEPYVLPSSAADEGFDFRAVRIDADQLRDELRRFEPALLWEGFSRFFNQVRGQHRRPLREMSRWHLALALAAGQVTGLITSEGGRQLLIKGDTYKKKERTVSSEVDGDGNVSHTVTMLDRFVPVINAIEFTPGPHLGQIVRIS